MNILITGIYGFLGFHLAHSLSKSNTVFGLYNTAIKKGLEDIVPVFSSLDQIDFHPDVIVMCHAAVVSGSNSISNKILQEVNVVFTKKIMEKFPHSKCIYISSVSVYGESVEKISEFTRVNPLSDYAKSKYLGEQLVMYNSENKVIRVSSLYGEDMRENTLLPTYCNQALQNNTIEVWGTGSRKQNYIHVEDVIRLIENVINFNAKINFPILGVDNTEYSNLEIANVISQYTNAEIRFINEDNSSSFLYDNSKSRELLKWEPSISLSEGLKKYIKWKRKQY